jgi:hypothetical protein
MLRVSKNRMSECNATDGSQFAFSNQAVSLLSALCLSAVVLWIWFFYTVSFVT